ncbi:hypothetical protein CWM47_30920 [Spirosoma pollinicola]|uniref:Uncharacterized protein n=2 Tax=Spirosoma pollinicola TaxID=2057025 RepID=A0A2K8Z7M2_9BACT|nr:hypothetical protein CWM47_30920 [Spirosoma pollinicola]RZM25064.1 MAG: hypothetical protein EOO88_20600 [Pedobacter sp.]
MKTIQSVILALGVSLLLGSCSTIKMNFVTSSVVPAATGEVKVKKDKNKNYVINVTVLNLADPKKLTPAKESYLVWMESSGNSVKKLGQIDTSSGLLSKTRKGEVSATAVAEPTRVFITAENDVSLQYPAGDVVLTTNRK